MKGFTYLQTPQVVNGMLFVILHSSKSSTNVLSIWRDLSLGCLPQNNKNLSCFQNRIAMSLTLISPLENFVF